MNKRPVILEDILRNTKKAMIIGIGGGGDVVGTVPTACLLSLFGIETVLGGLSWERSVHDPVPGPRRYDEVKNAERINEAVWFASGDTTIIHNSFHFAESHVADILGEKTLLIDIDQGTKKLSEFILDAAMKLGCDLVVGIDVGGDAVALGHEPGLMSPLADSVMISALYNISCRISCIGGVFGFGSDGELTLGELEHVFRIIAANGGLLGSWGLTGEALTLMKRLISVVPTEASRCPVEYSMGIFEQSTIRRGTRHVELNLSSVSTYYLDICVLYEKISKTARAVTESDSLTGSNSILNGLGIRTELDIENEFHERERN